MHSMVDGQQPQVVEEEVVVVIEEGKGESWVMAGQQLR